MEAEIWRDIDGYENLYQVSNLGNVRSLDRYSQCKNNFKQFNKGCVLKQKNNKNGYKQINLHKDGKRKTYLVHRLVAQTFIQNPNNYPMVNHKDENKSNNIVDNLEFCTCEYNINYGTRTEKMIKTKTNNPSESKPVVQYTLNGYFVADYPSTHEAERQTGIHSGSISKCCLRKGKSAGGFIWKYKNEE